MSSLAVEKVSTTVTLRKLATGQAMNVMLLFIPVVVLGERLGAWPLLIFTCSAISCVTLSYRLGQATESLGSRLGPVSGGLLNATFGNAAELIISITALQHGLFVVVRTSLLFAGLKYRDLTFSRSLVQIDFTIMFLAILVISLPSLLFALSPADSHGGVTLLTPTLMVFLIVIYACAVFFALRRQPEEQDEDGRVRSSLPKGLLTLAASTGGIVLISEYLVASILPFAESTGVSQVFIGIILIPIFSNVVDHIVAISVALKNRMDLSLTISVGSAAQVACLVLPAIVLIGIAMGHSAELIFKPVELIALAVGLALMVPVLLDGDSNWLEGAELLTCYLILASVLWVL